MKKSKYDILDMQGLFRIVNIRRFRPRNVQNQIKFVRELDLRLDKYNNNPKTNLNFEIIENVQYPVENRLDKTLFANNIITIQYQGEELYEDLYTKINGEFVKLPGKRRLDKIKDYIFIIYPDLIFFKGSKEGFGRVWREFNKLIQDIINVTKDYSFDVEYFMFLMQKIMFNDSLNNQIEIIFLEDILFDGKEETAREILKTKGLMNVLSSKYVNLKLLNNNKPKECIFTFVLNNWTYSVKIAKDGSLDFFQNTGSFKKAFHNLRAFMGCYFVKNLIDHYDFWSSLDNCDKYIKIDFIKKITRHMKVKKDIDCEKNSMNLINHYNELKGVR